jgi:hypothetical protein
VAYYGLVALSSNLVAGQVTKTAAGALQDADASVSYRIYGPSGLMSQGTGTMTLRDQGNVTAATNASPIQITSTAHGLSTGTRVTIAGVGGNTAANSTFTVTVVDANNFTLGGSTGNGAYTSGGTWHSTGLYVLTTLMDPNNGFASGQSYWLFVSYAVSSTMLAELHTFTVV